MRGKRMSRARDRRVGLRRAGACRGRAPRSSEFRRPRPARSCSWPLPAETSRRATSATLSAPNSERSLARRADCDGVDAGRSRGSRARRRAVARTGCRGRRPRCGQPSPSRRRRRHVVEARRRLLRRVDRAGERLDDLRRARAEAQDLGVGSCRRCAGARRPASRPAPGCARAARRRRRPTRGPSS